MRESQNRQFVNYAILLIAYAQFSLSANAHDFAYTEEIPEVITVEWTEKQVQKAVTRIDVEDTEPQIVLDDCNSYYMNRSAIIKVDYSQVVFPEDVLVTLIAENIPWIDIVRHVAKEIDAEIEIIAGKVILSTPIDTSVRKEKEVIKSRPEKLLHHSQESKIIETKKESAVTSKDSFWLWIIIVFLLVIILYLALKKNSKKR